MAYRPPLAPRPPAAGRRMKRRTFLTWGAVAAAGAAGITAPIAWDLATRTPSRAAGADIPPPYGAAFRRPPVLRPYETGTDERGLFAKYTVTETAGRASILPGLSTAVYGYNGLFPGPTIAVDRGTRVQLRVRNQLPAVHPLFGHDFETSTHLHGSASLPQYDGYANDVTAVGSYKEYEYPNFQGARTLWYHDRAVDHTSQNVYSGLLAQYHLYDEFERGQLPRDEFDVPLVLTDALFAGDGSLSFQDQNHAGLYGDVIVVNGVAWPTMKVKRRVYRFRVLDRLGVALLPATFEQRRTTHDRGHRRWLDVGPASRGRVPAGRRRTVRGAHRLRPLCRRHAGGPAQRQQPAQRRLRRHRQGHALRSHRRGLRRGEQRHPRPARRSAQERSRRWR
ncbi:MAG: multicopper oxidase domain-containing protein [Mycobacteriales bacterium]